MTSGKRWTDDEYQTLMRGPDKAKHKYGAKPITVNGERFDSTGEYRRWCELKLLERSGAIHGLKRQRRYTLKVARYGVPWPDKETPILYASGRKAAYVADFVYEENGKMIIEDFKGVDTPLSKLKRAIVETMFKTKIRITGNSSRGN